MSEDKDVAEALNQFFSSVFTIEGDVPARLEKIRADLTDLTDVVITKEQIVKKIKKLKTASAPGADSITARILQVAPEETAAALEIIFNKSLQSGEVPRD